METLGSQEGAQEAGSGEAEGCRAEQVGVRGPRPTSCCRLRAAASAALGLRTCLPHGLVTVYPAPDTTPRCRVRCLRPSENEGSGEGSWGPTEGAHASDQRVPVPHPASEWVPVNARPAMVTQQTVRNLALGDKLFLRVAAVSLAGAGPPAVLDQLVHIREAVGKALLPAPQAPCPIDREASWGRRYPLLLTRSGCVLPPSGHKVPGPSVARGRGRSRGHAPEGSTPSLGRGLPGPQNERTRPRWEEAEGREGISTHGGQCPAVAKFLFVGALASGLPSLPPTAGPISAGGGERRS